MAKYKTTTIQAESLDGLRPELAQSIRGVLQARGMADMEQRASLIIQTSRERLNPGLLARLFGDPFYYMAACFSPDWLIIARSYSKAGALPPLIIRLTQIYVANRETHSSLDPMALYPEEDGVTIYGHIGDSPEKSSFLIPLDSGPSAQKFRAELSRAISAAR